MPNMIMRKIGLSAARKVGICEPSSQRLEAFASEVSRELVMSMSDDLPIGKLVELCDKFGLVIEGD